MVVLRRLSKVPYCFWTSFGEEYRIWLNFEMRTMGVSNIAAGITTLYFNQCVERVVKSFWMWLWLEGMTVAHCSRPQLPQCLYPSKTPCIKNSSLWTEDYNCLIFNSDPNVCIHSFCKERKGKDMSQSNSIYWK